MPVKSIFTIEKNQVSNGTRRLSVASCSAEPKHTSSRSD